MTDKELMEQSKKLAVAWESLKVSIDDLSVTKALVNHDNGWCSYFFQSQQSSNLESNLLNIASVMLEVSNDICPED
ncbi:hypothetical protein HZI70_06245 [Lactiplantibacillus plantarum]|uniref:hypothetical protein n=1 Tax=Lactiplantibacillus plantarum TaxID=1590 RepID=UPI001FCE060B|nr:hypothetical protein [Lactiplantibacillus plantarum]MCJ2383717.1 hypothetical protein [Lactiplantibacillus plantarum]